MKLSLSTIGRNFSRSSSPKAVKVHHFPRLVLAFSRTVEHAATWSTLAMESRLWGTVQGLIFWSALTRLRLSLHRDLLMLAHTMQFSRIAKPFRIALRYWIAPNWSQTLIL